MLHFGEYTLEAIIIYVLGMLYNSVQESPMVRVSTLLDMLDRTVRTQADIIKTRTANICKGDVITQANIIKTCTANICKEVRHDKRKGSKRQNQYLFGVLLLELMKERQLIIIDACSTENQNLVVKKVIKNINISLYVI